MDMKSVMLLLFLSALVIRDMDFHNQTLLQRSRAVLTASHHTSPADRSLATTDINRVQSSVERKGLSLLTISWLSKSFFDTGMETE